MRPLTSLLLALLLFPCVALADDTGAAAEMVYEAADAIDAARAEQQAGRADEADRLLREAEVRLTEARKLAPDLARIGFELARIHLLRGDADAAHLTLEGALKLELPIEEHVRMAVLLDEVRAALGRPSAGASWKRSQQIRNGGLGVLAGGLAVLGVGLALAYISFDQAATSGVTEDNLQLNRFGWAFAGIGGGIAAGGGALTIVGQVRVETLRAVLPGPWRLADTTVRFELRVRF
jgi:tetratricopeptide (TPR) repeat protein